MENSITQKEADEFQGAILTSVEQHTAPYPIKLKGIDYVMFPDVFNPNYAKASLLLLDNLGVEEGEDVVLDLFSGSGADAIFSVIDGAIKAVAIDKFEMPCLCARYNAIRLGLENKVDVRQGDLFDALRPDEKFDLVVANPPFRSIGKSSNMEAALNDPGYKILERFFTEVGDYMKPDGRLRLVFSDVGDMNFLQQLAEENGFASEVVAEDRYAAKVKIEVYEMRRK